ncbi:MAG: hypothetical protein R2761_15995 [Acidimicrobiales bacterium]
MMPSIARIWSNMAVIVSVTAGSSTPASERNTIVPSKPAPAVEFADSRSKPRWLSVPDKRNSVW